MRHTKILLGIIALSVYLYFPSLFTFFTNDDFYFLKISKATSVLEFFRFFDLTQKFENFGFYRPLTTQAFYFMANTFFGLNPLYMHIIALGFFVLIIYMVYKLANIFLTKEQGLICAYLYGVSPNHFGQLYYLAVFQELGMTLFCLVSAYFYLLNLPKSKNKYIILSTIFYIFALMSKETAIVLPAILGIVFFLGTKSEYHKKVKHFFLSILPHIVVSILYLYIHVFWYGFAQGDTYIWDFTAGRFLNTIGWYGLWSMGLPEMLVDFVGPGFSINPTLFRHWGREFGIILALFFLQLVVFLTFLIFYFKTRHPKVKPIVFGLAWFIMAVLPVAFLPFHKFVFYLTLPMVGVSFVVASIINPRGKQIWLTGLFMTVYFLLSINTLAITRKTNWITRGAAISQNVKNYLDQNRASLEGKTLYFFDTQDDLELPWSPTQTLKVTLSDNNFFESLFNGQIKAVYAKEEFSEGFVSLRARDFLGY